LERRIEFGNSKLLKFGTRFSKEIIESKIGKSHLETIKQTIESSLFAVLEKKRPDLVHTRLESF